MKERPVAYYNEIDPYAAQWLRNLIAAGHIAPGDVDERSIEDVNPDDLRNYTQCHFFAGIGVWSYALRNAGWPDNKPVWTGSCPCQPFSAAGKGSGFDDERHLWPHFHWLISECRPQHVLGEQVASGNANAWFDLVQADLEAMDYAFGLVPFPSAGVGAPHIRDRAYWVANANGERWNRSGNRGASGWDEYSISSVANRVADTHSRKQQQNAERIERVSDVSARRLEDSAAVAGFCRNCRLADTDGRNPCTEREQCSGEYGQQQENIGIVWQGDSREWDSINSDAPAYATNGFWRSADWLFCRDEKWRPVRPGSFPLVNGATARVGRLRAYGNAINAEAAQTFINAYMEIIHGKD
ncbi:DNA cytosine methyltransferase [Serratia marcescens]|uniref:DNA cytosine methyltransferase n=1 Tax=Serratia marcescens TaxID=615 RepID=A0ABD5ILT4_SERMA|nr:DNA cytosine methyltransferase [Serratia marcescens]MDX7085060.1 DNA cytosine methyltransferase [Serratia marcescens]